MIHGTITSYGQKGKQMIWAIFPVTGKASDARRQAPVIQEFRDFGIEGLSGL
jgi:hypothetical protein